MVMVWYEYSSDVVNNIITVIINFVKNLLQGDINFDFSNLQDFRTLRVKTIYTYWV